MKKILIKICGITEKKEALWLNENKVDFAGFVLFFPKSKRNITIELAQSIFNELDKNISKVAVVVSPSLEQAKAIESAGFDYIQIHGDLDKRIYSETSIPILRAFNGIEKKDFEDLLSYDRIAGFVFDAAEPGSGKAFDWTALDNLPSTDKLVLLAGGLSPDNVSDAIKSVKCIDGVDVSSGVEIAPDVRGKDLEKINKFVKNVRTTISKF